MEVKKIFIEKVHGLILIIVYLLLVCLIFVAIVYNLPASLLNTVLQNGLPSIIVLLVIVISFGVPWNLLFKLAPKVAKGSQFIESGKPAAWQIAKIIAILTFIYQLMESITNMLI